MIWIFFGVISVPFLGLVVCGEVLGLGHVCIKAPEVPGIRRESHPFFLLEKDPQDSFGLQGKGISLSWLGLMIVYYSGRQLVVRRPLVRRLATAVLDDLPSPAQRGCFPPCSGSILYSLMH